VAVFIPAGVVVFGLDNTIERRRGEQITAKGIYRDLVRSSRAHVVKASGLRWLACMVLAPLAWADRVWALPFLTVLCPSGVRLALDSREDVSLSRPSAHPRSHQ